MIGWKGGRSSDRFEAAAARDKRKLLDRFAEQFEPKVEMGVFDNPAPAFNMGIGVLPSRLRMQPGSMVLSAIATSLPPEPPSSAGPPWRDFINEDSLSGIVEEIQGKLEVQLDSPPQRRPIRAREASRGE